jgi:hypothetical protein
MQIQCVMQFRWKNTLYADKRIQIPIFEHENSSAFSTALSTALSTPLSTALSTALICNELFRLGTVRFTRFLPASQRSSPKSRSAFWSILHS